MWKTLVRITTTAYNLALGFGVVFLVGLIFKASLLVTIPLATMAALIWAWFRAKHPDALRDDTQLRNPRHASTREEAIVRLQSNAHSGSGL